MTGLRRFDLWAPIASPALVHAVLHPAQASAPEVATGDVTIFDGTGRVLACARGLELRRSAARRVDGADQGRRGLVLRGRVGVKAAVRPASAASALASPVDIAVRLASEMAALATAHALDVDDVLLRALDVVATEHVVQALRALGWDPRPGDRVVSKTLAAELGVVPPTTGCSAGCSRCSPRTACWSPRTVGRMKRGPAASARRSAARGTGSACCQLGRGRARAPRSPVGRVWPTCCAPAPACRTSPRRTHAVDDSAGAVEGVAIDGLGARRGRGLEGSRFVEHHQQRRPARAIDRGG